MKRIIVFFMTLILSSSVIASDSGYYCKADYERKLERIENNGLLRNIPRLPLAVGGMYSLGTGLVALGLAGTGAGIAVMVGGPLIFQPVLSILDRESGLLHAKSSLDISDLAEEDVLPATHKAIMKERNRLISDSDVLEELLSQENKERTYRGESEISEAQFIIDFLGRPLPTKRSKNGIDWIQNKLNKKLKRKGIRPKTYEEVRSMILAEKETDFFCPNGRPITSNKAARIFFRRTKENSF